MEILNETDLVYVIFKATHTYPDRRYKLHNSCNEMDNS
jgi:hypothetical protein